MSVGINTRERSLRTLSNHVECISELKDGRHPTFAEGCLGRLISLHFQSTLGVLRKLWGRKAESPQLARELGGFQHAWELSMQLQLR